jgi:serine/threonine protein kinase
MNWAVILKLATDIAQGMRFMHNFQPALIHRDLKSPNVLVRQRKSSSPRARSVQLTDSWECR